MTPLAMRIARELTLPVGQRTFENKRILSMVGKDMHCFDITAIYQTVEDALQEDKHWKDVSSILPDFFLPSPITWIEFNHDGARTAFIIEGDASGYTIHICNSASFIGITLGEFKGCSLIQSPDGIAITPNDYILEQYDNFENEKLARILKTKEAKPDIVSVMRSNVYEGDVTGKTREAINAKADIIRLHAKKLERDQEALSHTITYLEKLNHAIKFAVLAIDLINTPGIVGMKTHAPHAGLAKKLAKTSVGKYPLQSWSEVVVKTHTTISDDITESGATFRKCLHFVRAHTRHYKDGTTSVIRAHWRGDPALGIKRTRYRVTP